MEIDKIKVLDAVIFAIDAHDGQRRKYVNEPYIMHPIWVARRVMNVPDATTEMVQAALLHDVLEDCPQISFNQIIDKFGLHVFKLVEALTDEKPYKGGPNRAQRKRNTADRLLAASWAAQTIKCADILDNLDSIITNDPNFGKVFLTEATALMDRMPHADPVIREEVYAQLDYYKRWGLTHSA